MIADDELSTDEFRRRVVELVDDAALRARMAEAARARKSADAASNLADVVMGAARASRSYYNSPHPTIDYRRASRGRFRRSRS